MTFSDKINGLARRGRATTRLEKALGGFDQATWALETLATYLEHGGTLGGLHILIGEDVDRELQQLGEQPPPGEDPRPLPDWQQTIRDAADHSVNQQRAERGLPPLSRAEVEQVQADLDQDAQDIAAGKSQAPVDPDAITMKADTELGQVEVNIRALDGERERLLQDPTVTIYRVLTDGDILPDDEGLLTLYFDLRLPSYLQRLATAGVAGTSSASGRLWLISMVGARGETDRIS